jgi:putative hydrolase of the HAD superfamily
MVAGVMPPKAVLLDVGGVFLLPEHDRIRGALARADVDTSADLDDVHYTAAAAFGVDADAEADWAGCWGRYLDAYVAACGLPDEVRADVHQHLDSEFADAALWMRVVPGCREGIRRLADTGVRLGLISNADGLIGQRLRDLEILQVGPGLGVDVECVIDSGVVGVMKPNVRIFQMALDALGLEPDDAWYVGDLPGIDVVGPLRAGMTPVLMDPLGLHHEAEFDRVSSLSELAERITAT